MIILDRKTSRPVVKYYLQVVNKTSKLSLITTMIPSIILTFNQWILLLQSLSMIVNSPLLYANHALAILSTNLQYEFKYRP
jgi:hypothetical protein